MGVAPRPRRRRVLPAGAVRKFLLVDNRLTKTEPSSRFWGRRFWGRIFTFEFGTAAVTSCDCTNLLALTDAMPTSH